MRSIRLFPAPHSLAYSGERAARGAPPTFTKVPGLPPEGFELIIASDGIRIAHADANGRRYAEAVLAQIRRQSADELPGLRISDRPDFPVRGYMMDISRDRVPTRGTLERIVDLLALCRINQFQLYTEHTFAYRDHACVWRDASPLTADDVKWLDGICSEKGIGLVANQNTFGHMDRWLRHPEHRERAEAPDGFEGVDGKHRPAAVLAPTQGNADFALSLVRELMENFSSRRVHIGCDETFELGLGRSRERVAEQGRGRVYLEHLLRLMRPLHAEGTEVLFWGDILRRAPELIPELPRDDTVALAWHYEAPVEAVAVPSAGLADMERLGFTTRGFVDQVLPFAEADFPYWVCPGTSTWNSLIGRLPNARANLLDAAVVGREFGARGYLITDWGDNGHLQPLSVSFGPLVFGAAVSWGHEQNRDLDVSRVLDELVFMDSACEFGAALERIGSLYSKTGQFVLNASPLQAALHRGALLAPTGKVDDAGTRGVVDALEQAMERVVRARPTCTDSEIARDEITQAIRLARHGAWRMLREAGRPCPSDAALRSDLSAAIESQRSSWLTRSRPGGLTDSVGRLEETLATYR